MIGQGFILGLALEDFRENNANLKNEVFLQLGSVRPSTRPYKTVRSFR